MAHTLGLMSKAGSKTSQGGAQTVYTAIPAKAAMIPPGMVHTTDMPNPDVRVAGQGGAWEEGEQKVGLCVKVLASYV